MYSLSCFGKSFNKVNPVLEEVNLCLQSCWVLGLDFTQTLQCLTKSTNCLAIVLILINFNLEG